MYVREMNPQTVYEGDGEFECLVDVVDAGARVCRYAGTPSGILCRLSCKTLSFCKDRYHCHSLGHQTRLKNMTWTSAMWIRET